MVGYAAAMYGAALMIGLDKGGIPGLGALGLTTVLSLAGPGHLARRTIGIFVPTLAAADVSAVYAYRDAVRWDIIRGLVLPMAVGMFFGFLLLGRMPDEEVRVCVGWALIVVSGASCFNACTTVLFTAPGRSALFKTLSSGTLESLDNFGDKQLPTHHHHNQQQHHPSAGKQGAGSFLLLLQQRFGVLCGPSLVRAAVGCLAGLLTVVANVAGPVVAVYLIALQLPKRQLNGTRAWLFLISNACKLPGQLLLGNLRLSDFSLVVPLCIAAALSTYATELFIFPRIEQRLFERLSWRSVCPSLCLCCSLSLVLLLLYPPALYFDSHSPPLSAPPRAAWSPSAPSSSSSASSGRPASPFHSLARSLIPPLHLP